MLPPCTHSFAGEGEAGPVLGQWAIWMLPQQSSHLLHATLGDETQLPPSLDSHSSLSKELLIPTMHQRCRLQLTPHAVCQSCGLLSPPVPHLDVT